LLYYTRSYAQPFTSSLAAMNTLRIHIQPCAAGYAYRIGSHPSLRIARRDDCRSRLYDDLHELYLTATGRRSISAAREQRLIQRVVELTARPSVSPSASYPVPQGDGAMCQEPACTYLPTPDGEEEWTVEYDVEPARASIVEAPPLRCRAGHPAYPVVVEVMRSDGSPITEAEWEAHIEGLYTAARNDMRYVEEPPARYAAQGPTYWQLVQVVGHVQGQSAVHLLELGERCATPYWSNLEPVRRVGPVRPAEAARWAETRSREKAQRMVWLPPRTLHRGAWDRLARAVTPARAA
jgi:hypothetical protein